MRSNDEQGSSEERYKDSRTGARAQVVVPPVQLEYSVTARLIAARLK